MAPPAQTSVYDMFGSFGKGMDFGVDPQLIPKDQQSFALNTTFRGNFAGPRPAVRKINIPAGSPFTGAGYFGDAQYYLSDFGVPSLFLNAGGKFYQFSISGTDCTVTDWSIPGDDNLPAVQSFLYQAENYLICQNGNDIPWIFDGQISRRASVGQSIATVAASGSDPVPAPGLNFNVVLTAPYTGAVNIPATLSASTGQQLGAVEVVSFGSALGGYIINIEPISGPGQGNTLSDGTQLLIDNSYSSTTTASGIGSGPLVSNDGVTRANMALVLPYNGIVGDKISVQGTSAGVPGNYTMTVRSTTNPSLIAVTYVGASGVQVKKGGNVIKLNPPAPTVAATFKGTFTSTTDGTPGTAHVVAPYTGPNNQTVFSGSFTFIISAGTASSGSNNLTLQNISVPGGTPSANYVNGSVNQLSELPTGLQGCYVLGRIWQVMPDGLSFIAGDIVGGSSGTVALGYRDAVLHVTENSILAQGGAFRVPGSAGKISFITFLSTLDSSLGQGPVQIGTPTMTFSCNAPQDRTQWVNVTSPILTVSLLTNGGLGQNGQTTSNGDLFFRSIDGIRSLILGRREFWTWGETPQSNEVRPILLADDPSLLPFTSMTVFDNRLLCSCTPASGPQGTYGTQAAVINFDPISSLRGKAPSIYDGIWNGLNVLKYVKGIFYGVERCYAFTYNTDTLQIELYEVLKTSDPEINDSFNTDVDANGNPINTTPIDWAGELPVMFNARQHPDKFGWTRLLDGEIYVKDLQGDVTFRVWYRPDYDSTWHPWRAWTVPKGAAYYPRMGLGEPPAEAINGTDTPSTVGYGHQIKIEVDGHCFLMGGRLMGTTVDEPSFAAPLVGNDFLIQDT